MSFSLFPFGGIHYHWAISPALYLNVICFLYDPICFFTFLMNILTDTQKHPSYIQVPYNIWCMYTLPNAWIHYRYLSQIFIICSESFVFLFLKKQYPHYVAQIELELMSIYPPALASQVHHYARLVKSFKISPSSLKYTVNNYLQSSYWTI